MSRSTDSEYELTGWVRTRDVQAASWQGARIGVYGQETYLSGLTPALVGSQEWSRVSTRFITGKTTTGIVVGALDQGTGAAGLTISA